MSVDLTPNRVSITQKVKFNEGVILFHNLVGSTRTEWFRRPMQMLSHTKHFEIRFAKVNSHTNPSTYFVDVYQSMAISLICGLDFCKATSKTLCVR